MRFDVMEREAHRHRPFAGQDLAPLADQFIPGL